MVSEPCVGVRLAKHKTALCSESVLIWVQAGMVWANTETGVERLQQIMCNVHSESEGPIARHVQCSGQKLGPNMMGCELCTSLVMSKKLGWAISHWAYRVDLASYAYALAYGDSSAVRAEAETWLFVRVLFRPVALWV